MCCESKQKMLNYNMPSCNPTQWKTTQPPCRHAALCLHVLKHIPSLASLVCPGGRWPASAQAPVLLSSPKWLALTLVAPPPPSLGLGKPGPASSQLSPRLRTDLCCPVVSVVSVVPSCPSNSGLRLLQDEKSSSVGHLYTLGNRGRAAKWLLFWNHKRL